MRLEETGAIVTGGARGSGAGIARRLAAEGARVARMDVDGGITLRVGSVYTATGGSGRPEVWRVQ